MPNNEIGYQPDYSDEAAWAEKSLDDEQKQALTEKIIGFIEGQAKELGINFESNPKSQIKEKIRGLTRKVIVKNDKIYYEAYRILSFKTLENLLTKEILPRERVIVTPDYNDEGLLLNHWGHLAKHPKFYINYETTDPHPMVDEIKEMGFEQAKVVPYPEHGQLRADRGQGEREYPFVMVDGKHYEPISGETSIRHQNFKDDLKHMIDAHQDFVVTPVYENPYDYTVEDIPCAVHWAPFENN